jgi:hypothetical protein
VSPLLFLSLALAQVPDLPIVGIPAANLPGPVAHQSSTTGYSVGFKKGIVRVYIGPDAAALDSWMETMGVIIERHRPKPIEGLGDTALAVGANIVLVREDNLGIMVQCDGRAQQIARDLLAAAVRAPFPWPAAPPLIGPAEGPWRIDAPEAVETTWIGGRLVPGPEGATFSLAPRTLIAWDRWGRATRADFGPDGLPLQLSWDAATP